MEFLVIGVRPASEKQFHIALIRWVLVLNDTCSKNKIDSRYDQLSPAFVLFS